MTAEQRTPDKGDGLVEPAGHLKRGSNVLGQTFLDIWGLFVAESLMKPLFGKESRRWQPEERGQFSRFDMSVISPAKKGKKWHIGHL